MWLSKLPFDQNPIAIHYKFNDNFESHINFEEIKREQKNGL
jgi:hypothetical protein